MDLRFLIIIVLQFVKINKAGKIQLTYFPFFTMKHEITLLKVWSRIPYRGKCNIQVLSYLSNFFIYSKNYIRT